MLHLLLVLRLMLHVHHRWVTISPHMLLLFLLSLRLHLAILVTILLILMLVQTVLLNLIVVGELFSEVCFLVTSAPAIVNHLLLRRGSWVLIWARWAHQLLLPLVVLGIDRMAVLVDLEVGVRAVAFVALCHWVNIPSAIV